MTDAGLEGVSEVEFRRDADGRPLLMEINARISQSVALAHRAGVELAQLQLRWARGEHLEPVADYRRGVRLGWPAGEARLLACGLIGRLDPRPSPLGELRDIARDYGSATRAWRAWTAATCPRPQRPWHSRSEAPAAGCAEPP